MAIKQLIAIATSGKGIQVNFGGNQAYTDGKMINLPAEVTPEAEEMTLGYAWHESFHIEHTDFSVALGLEKEIKAQPLLKELENCLEDGRIERVSLLTFPGTRRVMDDLIAAIVKRGEDPKNPDPSLFNEPPQDIGAPNALLGFVLNWTRKNVNGYSAIQFLGEWRGALVNAIGESLVSQIEDLLEQHRMVEDTAQAFDVSARILDLVKFPPKEQDKSGGNGQGEGKPEPGENDASGGGQGSPETGDQPQSQNNGQSGDPSDDKQQDGPGKSGDSKPDPSGKPDGKDAASGKGERTEEQEKARKSILSATKKDLADTDLGDIAGKAINQEQAKVPPGARKGPGGPGNCFSLTLPPARADESLYKEVAASAGALGSRLGGIIEGQTLVKGQHTRRSGKRLNIRKLARVGMGDSRVFKRPLEEVDTTGHIHVLLDTSGSMEGSVALLRRSGLASVRAIESVGGLSVSASTLPAKRGPITVLKTPHESSIGVAGRFRDIKASGGTPMTGSIEAIEFFLKLPVSSRLLIIFTDGQPHGTEEVEKCVERLAREGGVYSAAVILGDKKNSLENFMDCRRIKSLAELPKVVTDLCGTIIRNKMRRIA